MPYLAGGTLVLYTDGLVERRGEDIDTSVQRLTGILAGHARLRPHHLADTLLSASASPAAATTWR